jgi:hypothetical protein
MVELRSAKLFDIAYVFGIFVRRVLGSCNLIQHRDRRRLADPSTPQRGGGYRTARIGVKPMSSSFVQAEAGNSAALSD